MLKRLHNLFNNVLKLSALLWGLGLVTSVSADPLLSDAAPFDKPIGDKSMAGRLITDNSISDKTIVVRTQAWEQLTYADGSGYMPDLLRAVYEPFGFQIEVKICPWRRCLLDVIEGSADIIIGVFDDEEGVEGKIQVPRYPVLQENISVAFKKTNQPEWRGQENLRNKRIAQIRGYGYHNYLAVPAKPVDVTNIQQAWHMLMADRVDYYIDGHRILGRIRQQEVDDITKFQIEPVYQKYAYYGFNLSDRGTGLMQIFEQQLPKLYQSGEKEKLRLKWDYFYTIPFEEIKELRH